MSAADLAAVMNSDGDGFGNGNGWWIILLFLFLGWGRGGYGYGGGNNDGNGMSIYPIMENQQNLFTGFGNLQNALCAGFANAETAATARQMADMQQMFSLSQQFSNCCCENRLGLANLGADIAREACADRAAVSDGVRDILANQIAVGQRQIDNQNQWGQRVIDWLCADRDARKDEIIADLRQQIALKDLAASQNLQTAQLVADNAAQTNALEQYLAPVPRPAYMVQNPNCCQPSFGYGGCGCAA
jgi:hypothetical protein